MKFPCSKHPANNIFVQELSALAALTYATTAAPHAGTSKHQNLFLAAEKLAQSDISFAELATYPGLPASHALDALPRSIAMHRLKRTQTWSAAEKVRRPSFPVAPSKAVALYGPYHLLPSLPAHAHDTISYDEAEGHLQLLRQLLGTYGFHVSLSGHTRRGCPVSASAEFIMSLQQQNAEEVEAAQLDLEGDEEAEGTAACTAAGSRARDHFVAPQATAPKSDAQLLTLGGLTAEEMPAASVFAAHDTYSSKLAHRTRRALQGLVHAGYVVAGSIPTHPQLEERTPYWFSVRLREDVPSRVPHHHATDTSALRLHRIGIRCALWQCLHVRQLFHTGPPAFVTHLTLKALEKGFELNLNGLFLCTKVSSANAEGHGEMRYKRVLVESEKDIFSLLEMPYVDPLNRGLFCEVHHLVD